MKPDKTFNQSFQFVPALAGLHRTAFPPLRCAKAAAEFGVKGLTPVFLGLVFGRGLGGCLQAENSPQSGNSFGGQSGVQVAGQSGAFIGQLPPIWCSGSWRNGSSYCKVSGVGIQHWVLK